MNVIIFIFMMLFALSNTLQAGQYARYSYVDKGSLFGKIESKVFEDLHVTEESFGVKYKSKHIVHLIEYFGGGNSEWKFGFAQVILVSDNDIEYSDIHTNWAFPKLPVNDGLLPWYSEKTIIDGRKRSILSMNDSVGGSVSWSAPLPPDASQELHVSDLKSIDRKQKFCSFVLGINEQKKEWSVVAPVYWSVLMHIKIDCTKEIGTRVVSKNCEVKIIGDEEYALKYLWESCINNIEHEALYWNLKSLPELKIPIKISKKL